MLLPFDEHYPSLGQNVFVAANAVVIGQTRLDDQASIWYGSIIRGDVGHIHIGARTNVQDLSVVHVTSGAFDTTLGDDVTVGHRAILHGCTVADHVLIGMGAIIMDGAQVGRYSIIGAGALVPPGQVVPPHSLVLGAPGRISRGVSDDEAAKIDASAAHYVRLAARHRQIHERS